MKLATNPHVQCRPSNTSTGFLIVNTKTGDRIQINDPALLSQICSVNNGMDRLSFTRQLIEITDGSRELAERICEKLLETRIIREYSQDDQRTESIGGKPYGYESGVQFLYNTTNIAFSDNDHHVKEHLQNWKERTPSEAETSWSIYRHRSSNDEVALPTPKLPDNSYPSDEMSLQNLGDVLYYTFGEQRQLHLPDIGELIQKTSPSGGSRHPTEAYVLSRGTSWLEKGTYHYSVKNHELHQLTLQEDAFEKAINNLMEKEARFLLIMSTVVQRSMQKYPWSHAYKVCMLDAGHLLGTLSVLSNTYGFNIERDKRASPDQLEGIIGTSIWDEPVLGAYYLRS